MHARIASIAGGITCAIPAPWTKNDAATTQIGVCSSNTVHTRRDTVVRDSPIAQIRFAPYRWTNSTLRGANTICANANGNSSRPVASGE